MTRTFAAGYLTIIVSVLMVSLAIGWNLSGPIRVISGLWFLLVIPGLSLIRLFRFRRPPIEWSLAIGLSLALDMLVAELAIYNGYWSPAVIVAALSVIALVGVGLQIALGHHRQTGPVNSLGLDDQPVGLEQTLRRVDQGLGQ